MEEIELDDFLSGDEEGFEPENQGGQGAQQELDLTGDSPIPDEDEEDEDKNTGDSTEDDFSDDPRKQKPAADAGDGSEEDGDGEGGDGEEGDGDDKTSPVETSVIEKFLADYNVVDGKLQTEDGKEVLFKDLNEDQKLSVLKQIVQGNAVGKLSDEEQSLIDSVRESKLSVDSFLTKKVQDIADAAEASKIFDSENYKFEDMSPELIYSLFLLEGDSKMTEEALEQEVTIAKQSKVFDATVKRLRENFISNRETSRETYVKELGEKRLSEAKGNVVKFVDAMRGTEEIAGWPITDDMRNETLGKLVELDPNGDSEFVTKVLSDPKELVKAAWLYYNAESKFDQITDYYKSKMQGTKKKETPQSQERMGAVKRKDKDKDNRGANVITLEDYLKS